MQTRFHQVLPECQVHVLHGFRKDSNLGSCINFQRKPRRTNSSQGAYHCSTYNETLFERKCRQARFRVFSDQDKRTKSEPGRCRHHDSPPPKQQEFVSLQIASFANPAVRTELHSSTNVRRQLRHRRLPLLEFLLRMKILPPGSIHSTARISETCLILCLATTREFAMKTSCPLCDVP